MMVQNAGSPGNTLVGVVVQPGDVAAAEGRRRREVKITKLEFGEAESCCGDLVELKGETQNFQDGAEVNITMWRSFGQSVAMENCQVEVSGNKFSQYWQSVRGPYEPNREAEYSGAAFGEGGPVESTNKHLVKTVPETSGREIVRQGTSLQSLVEVNDQGTAIGAIPLPNEVPFTWDVHFGINVKDGELVVTKEILFSGTPATAAQLTSWKQEIEAVWDNKFKIHRLGCMRGDACNCSNGCCMYPIRIRCEWGFQHGDAVSLDAGDSDPQNNRGWASHRWYQRSGPNDIPEWAPPPARPHEFGHLLGLYDEYYGGGVLRVNGAAIHENDDSSIMGGGTTVYPRHMQEFKDWFDNHAGSVIGGTYLVSS